MIDVQELRDSAQKAFPSGDLIPDRESGWPLAAELGWLIIRLPEEFGGLGLDREASTALHHEMGRVLSPLPLIPAQLGLSVLAASQALSGKAEWIERASEGEYIPLHLLPATLEPGADGALTGTVPGYLEADMAQHLIVDDGAHFVLIPKDADGVVLTERTLWDRSRRMFTLMLNGYTPTQDSILADGAAAQQLRQVIAAEAQIALAADCLGGAAAALSMTVDYMALRRQFDRPIAMFQALKHRVADLKVQCHAAESLLWSRCRADAPNPVDAAAVKALAAQCFADVTEESIQLHGGIGLTEDHHCHLFMKRAMLNQQLCVTADTAYEAAGRAALSRLSD